MGRFTPGGIHALSGTWAQRPRIRADDLSVRAERAGGDRPRMSKKPTTGDSVRRATPPQAPRTGRANTLGMSGQQLDVIYEQLDAFGTGTSHKRQSSRLEFRQPSIGVDIIQPGGGQTHINVACRNLSRTGLGFLHSSYVHVGTRVVLTLAHNAAAPARVAAKVMRCRHVTKNVHDVGVMFDEPINVRDFMALDPLDQTFTCEVVDPAQLKGTLMIVAEYEIERSCVRSMLGDTSLDFFCVPTVAEGLEKARKGVELVLCDDTFEVGSGVEFVQAARKSGLRCPIILMSADTSEQGLNRIRRAEANAFLAKPLRQDVLLRAIAEFLLMSGEKSGAAHPLSTTLPANSPMLDLSDLYVEDLGKVAEQIGALVGKGDLGGVRRNVLRVGGPAASLGFEPIAKLAQTLIAAIDTTKSLEQSIVAVNTFVAVCRGARKAVRPVPAPPEGARHVEEAHGDAKPADGTSHGKPADPHAKPAHGVAHDKSAPKAGEAKPTAEHKAAA